LSLMATVAEQLTNTVVARFTDGDPSPQLTDFSALVDWGDGTFTPGTIVADPNLSGTFDVLGNHTYTAATVGSLHVAIFDIGAATTVDSTVNVSQDNPVPVLTGLGSASATEGEAGFNLSVAGSGFLSGSVVQWSGTTLATTFVSATQLVA